MEDRQHAIFAIAYLSSDWPRPLEYITHLHSELARTGRGVDSIRDPLRNVLSDIEKWLNSTYSPGMQSLYDGRRLNLESLRRSHDVPVSDTTRNHLAIPRISIGTFATGKGNLSLRWMPVLLMEKGYEQTAPEWVWRPSDESPVGYGRPEYEVLFIHDIWDTQREEWDNEFVSVIKVTLLSAVLAMVNCTIRMIRYNFEVQIASEMRPLLVSAADHNVPCEEAVGKVPIGFKIIDMVDEERVSLREYVNSFEDTHGIALGEFWEICRHDRETAEGVRFDRSSRALKKRGLNRMTPHAVKNLVARAAKAINWGQWVPER